jgi:hypothetical protein
MPGTLATGTRAATKAATPPTSMAEHRLARGFLVTDRMRRPDMAKDDIAPGDMAPPGAPGTGENVCPDCDGSGQVDGGTCPTCMGTGQVIEGIGGA